MRIDGGPHGSLPELPERGKISDKKKSGSAGRSGGGTPASFLEELQAAVELEEEVSDANMPALIREVDAAGKEMLGRPEEETFKRYRKAVRTFLMAAVKRSFRLKVVEGRGANPKLYVFVEKVESKLDEIARQVLASHVNPLKLLAQVEELRGLLLDLRT